MNPLQFNKYSFNFIKTHISPSKSLGGKKVFTKSSVITSDMVGLRLKLYNGKDFAMMTIVADMKGYLLGEFVFTRARYEFKKKKKKK